MKWPSVPGDHVRTYGAKKRALTWQHLTLCSFWAAHGMLHSEDVTFLQIIRMQMQDREMPTRGQYRRLEWLATYAHRVYEQPVFVGMVPGTAA